MMTCQKLINQLLEFMAEELEAEHRAAVQQHLDGCASCVALVDSYRITITLTRQLPPLPLPPDFVRRLDSLLGELNASAGS